MFKHIIKAFLGKGNLEWKSIIIVCAIILLYGIFISLDEKSLVPIVLTLFLIILIILISGVYQGIKSWKFSKNYNSLSDDQKMQLMSDILDQARWDSKTRNQLKKFLDNGNKIKQNNQH